MIKQKGGTHGTDNTSHNRNPILALPFESRSIINQKKMNELTQTQLIAICIAATAAVFMMLATIIWIVWQQNKAEKKAQAHEEWKGFTIAKEADEKLSLKNTKETQLV